MSATWRRRKDDRAIGSSPSASGPPPAARDWESTEESFRLLAEHAPVGLYVTDTRGDVIYANPTLCAYAGIASREALGRGWLGGLHEDDRDRIGTEWYEAVARGEPWQAEYRYVDAEGGVTWVRGSAGPIRGADGTILGYAGMDLDVTAVKEAELEASLSSALLADAQALAHIGSWDWDIPGERLTWSDETYLIFGVDRDSPLTFEAISAAVHLEDRARNNDWVVRTMASGEPGEIDLRIVRPDGEIRHVHQTATVKHGENGEPVRAFGTIQDVTARRRAEAAARAIEARFSALIENADVAVWAVDRDLRLIVGNAAFHAEVCERMGHDFAPGDPLLTDELAPDVVTQWQAYYGRALSGERFSVEAPRRFTDPDGWMEYRFNPITDPDGNVTGVIAIGRDITDRHHADEERHRLVEELRLSEELLRQAEAITHAGGWSYDAASGQVRWTDEVYRIYGVDRDFDVSDMEAAESFYGPDGRDRIAEAFSRAVEHGEPYDLELPFVRGDGEHRWVRTSAQAVTEDGVVVRILGNIVDITERRAAEEALGASEAKARAVADFTYDWEYWRDVDGSFLYVSPSCERITGYAPEEFLADPDLLVRVIHPDDRDMFVRHHEERLAAGHEASCSLEFRTVHRSGETRWIGHVCRLVIDDEGICHGVRGSNRDITQHRLADAALRTSEALLRGLFEAMPNGCAIYEVRNDGVTGDDYIVKYFNHTSLAIENTTLDEVVGKSLRDLRPAIDDYGLIPVFQRVWQTGEPAYFPSRLYVDERYSNYYENHVFKLPSGEIVAIHNDVTEREQAAQGLRESEERWRSLTETSPDYIVTIGRDLTIEFANRASPGLTVEELIGTPLWTYVEEENRLDVKALHERVLQTGEPESYETVYTTPEGSSVYYESYAVPRRDPRSNAIVGLTISARDITDRKLAEQALRETGEHLSMAQLAAGAGMWDWDMTTDTLTWSPEFYTLFGLPADVEASFETWRSAVHPDDLESAEARIGAAVEQRVPLVNEHRIVHRDGAVLWIRARGDTTYDDTGRPLRMSGICIDITQQRQAETQLRESEGRFRTLVENVPGMVFRCEADPPWQDRFVSDEIERITGYSAEDSLSGRLVWTDIVLPDDLAELERTIEERRRAHRPHMVTYRIRHRDGSIRWVREIGRYAFDDSGRATHVDGVITDVTDQVMSEEQLRDREERFRGVVETSPTGIAIVDTAEQRFVEANDSFLKLTGYSRDELQALNIWDVTHPDDRQREEQLIAAYAAGEVDEYVIEKRYVRKDGEVRWVRLRGDALHLDPESPPLAIANVEDITDRRQAEDNLRASRERLHAGLQDAVKAMGGIVELRDPYTAGHERAVTRLAEAVAVEMGIDEAVRDGLVMAAEVHDVGKISIPAEILSKPAALTEMEFELVKQHPVTGRELVSAIDFERPVAQIVGQHHERLDGSGYPDGLKGDEILPEARILAVADVVEAMASHRPYRPALGMDAALAEIRRGAGTLYDADVVAACKRVIAGGFDLAG